MRFSSECQTWFEKYLVKERRKNYDTKKWKTCHKKTRYAVMKNGIFLMRIKPSNSLVLTLDGRVELFDCLFEVGLKRRQKITILGPAGRHIIRKKIPQPRHLGTAQK